MTIFLFRPSPQIPEPSVFAARICYDASIFNIKMQRKQIATRSIDLTWEFTQSLLTAINITLWSLSYPEIRYDHSIEEVSSYLQVALEGMAIAAEVWPGVQSTLHLYWNLIAACLNAYNTGESFVYRIPSTYQSPASVRDVVIAPNASIPSSITTGSYLSSRSLGSTSSAGFLQTVSRGSSIESVQSSPAGAAAIHHQYWPRKDESAQIQHEERIPPPTKRLANWDMIEEQKDRHKLLRLEL